MLAMYYVKFKAELLKNILALYLLQTKLLHVRAQLFKLNTINYV